MGPSSWLRHAGLPSSVLPTPLVKARANALLDHVVIVGHELWHEPGASVEE